ncbi:MAG: manganese efflux pump MntP family protein [Lachnospiraceae bacterium]
MSWMELFFIAVGLSMDAFAVSVCKGLAMTKCTWKKAGIVGLYFGVFQGGMPLLGYLLGVQFKTIITSIDHWIAFVLLSIIGLHMVKEARAENGCTSCGNKEEDSLDIKTMVGLAVATSIDALAVGVTFAFLAVQIVPAVGFIGAVTFLLSVAGVKMGHAFGGKYKAKAEMAGGIILVLMGVKILLQHLGIFS